MTPRANSPRVTGSVVRSTASKEPPDPSNLRTLLNLERLHPSDRRISHRPGDPQRDADGEHREPEPDRENGGSSASFIAMPAWNGLVGPNALPTIAAPALIATTATASMRSRRRAAAAPGPAG